MMSVHKRKEQKTMFLNGMGKFEKLEEDELQSVSGGDSYSVMDTLKLYVNELVQAIQGDKKG